MIDDRDPRDPSQAALIGAGFAGALLGGAVVWCLRLFRAGDEPPIRVKGGSLHIDATGGATWKMQGTDGKKWKLDKGSKNSDEYDVSIVASGSGCVNNAPRGKRVTLTYSDGTTVEIKAAGNNTMVASSERLTLGNGDQRLTYSGTGYIRQVDVDSSTCTFASGDFNHAWLADV
jgi:hypothetical protein